MWVSPAISTQIDLSFPLCPCPGPSADLCPWCTYTVSVSPSLHSVSSSRAHALRPLPDTWGRHSSEPWEYTVVVYVRFFICRDCLHVHVCLCMYTTPVEECVTILLVWLVFFHMGSWRRFALLIRLGGHAWGVRFECTFFFFLFPTKRIQPSHGFFAPCCFSSSPLPLRQVSLPKTWISPQTNQVEEGSDSYLGYIHTLCVCLRIHPCVRMYVWCGWVRQVRVPVCLSACPLILHCSVCTAGGLGKMREEEEEAAERSSRGSR